MFWEKDAARNARVPKILPATVTIRHPNLFVNPLTIGPTIKDIHLLVALMKLLVHESQRLK